MACTDVGRMGTAHLMSRADMRATGALARAPVRASAPDGSVNPALAR